MRVRHGDLADANTPYDLIIVGAGTAGPAMAAALAGSGARIALIEAGGDKQRRRVQDAYVGELVDPRVHPWLHHFRVRALGGASRIWGGRVMPFDPIDFDARPWVPGPGWPITREELLPWYARAQEAVEAGVFDYDAASVFGAERGAFVPGLDGGKIETLIERFSRPSDLWQRYRAAIEAAPDIHVFTDMPVTAIRLAADGSTVDHLEVAPGAGGERRKVRARNYVIATGGLESVRLLLASNDVRPAGIGNDHDLLGRFYMSHLAATSGTARFAATPHFDYERDAEGIYMRRRIAVSRAAQHASQTLNTIFRTHFTDPADPGHRDPILSAMYLVKDFVLYEYSRKFREHPVSWRQRGRHVMNVVGQPGVLARFGTKWVRDRILADRKLPSVVLGSRTNAFALEFHAEQAPNPDSRLSLSADRDALGMPRLRADWRCSDQDIESLQKSYAILAAELERTGTGRLDFDSAHVAQQAREAGAYGGHHLGAARMAADPREGVVDPECRVHGVGNLYVASGAVLPTSSQANPTLTILALALRLADRLKTGFRQ